MTECCSFDARDVILQSQHCRNKKRVPVCIMRCLIRCIDSELVRIISLFIGLVHMIFFHSNYVTVICFQPF